MINQLRPKIKQGEAGKFAGEAKINHDQLSL